MRTVDEIDQEYTDLCAVLGDIEIQKGMLEHKKNETIKKIARLSKEKTELTEAQKIAEDANEVQ